MGKINSKQKGNRGEREVAKLLREKGYLARRGQQFKGSPDSPDVISSLEGFHIEVKRVERLDLYGALEQADRDKGKGEKSLVFHRKNGKGWSVILDADVFLDLLDRIIEREL